jgi:UDP-N-acetylglucosamine kinase
VAEASDYFLTEDELKTRFEERVLEFVFGPYQPQDHPVLVLVGAQQAAGKSFAIAQARQRHAASELVPLTGDDLRFMHPRHDEILNNEPWLFLEATGQATAHWVKWSIDYARREKYSLILEGVFRDPAMPHATAQAFAPSHTVEVVGLAVREEVSRLDGEYRFLEGGRWTPPELHDLSYRMMPETIRVLAGTPAVSRVTITDRSGQDLYVLDKTSGRPVNSVDAERALLGIRSRPLPVDEARAWMARQRDTVITYAVRGAINDTSRPTLVQITREDAPRIMPMADPSPDSELRTTYEAVQPILQTLVDEPLQPSLPLRLRTDQELQAMTAGRDQEPGQPELAAETARRAALTSGQREAERLIQQQLHAALFPANAGNQELQDALADPDVQAALDVVASSNPMTTSKTSQTRPSAQRGTSWSRQSDVDPAAGLD